MQQPAPRHALILVCVLLAGASNAPARSPLDRAVRDLEQPITYDQMIDFLEDADRLNHIEVTVEGRSPAGNDILLVHVPARSRSAPVWRVFFYAQQHGNEPAGKDALLFMLKQIADEPDRLPPHVDLWAIPMVNPDGAIADKRTNDNGADPNRDHLLLTQPGPQAIHRVCRRVKPHLAVDAHESTRDSTDYRRQGWTEWPLIMMDTANHPLLAPGLYEAGKEWIEDAQPLMARSSFNYARYHVGAAPGQGEMRYSTLEADDGRNGCGLYGCLSFIIESGVYRGVENPHADLHQRVAAYLKLLWNFVENESLQARHRPAVEEAPRAPLPDFIATNTFWGSVGPQVTEVNVIAADTGQTRIVPTANFMHNRIVKHSVPRPLGYLVKPQHAPDFAALLDRFEIEYQKLERPRDFHAEACRLVRLDEALDPLYNRYGGRQIVERGSPRWMTCEPGGLFVELKPAGGRHAMAVLEPMVLYGLYQFEDFRRLIGPDRIVPVHRVLDRR